MYVTWEVFLSSTAFVKILDIIKEGFLGLNKWELVLCRRVHRYCKLRILRAKFFFDSSRLRHIFLFFLNCAIPMLFDSCFTILNIFRKSLKHVRNYFNDIGFWSLFFNSIHLLILCGDVEQNPEPKNTNFFLYIIGT